MRIALLQINPTAGDLKGNSALIARGVRAARSQGANLAVTPELGLMGYLPRDLLMNRGFVRRAGQTLDALAAELKDGPPLLVGLATPNPGDGGRPLFNSAVLLKDGAAGPVFHKTLLPTYDVFDEDRYFEPATGPQILELHIEQCQSAEDIIAQGFDEPTVRRVLKLVRAAEFKRKQAAPALKVTSRAFGTGWRMPIVRQE